MLKLLREYGIFFLVPGIVLTFSILLKIASGPYWLATNFDGSYIYLDNGLEIIKNHVPDDTTHPGTPMEILFATVSFLFNAGHSVNEILQRVLRSPEFYLQIVFGILTGFSFLISVFLGVYVFRKTKDKMAGLIGQLPVLSFLVLRSFPSTDPIIPVVANVDSEPLLICIINLFNLGILKYYFAQKSSDRLIASLLWGFVAAWGVAEKFTFIPVLLVALIILTWRDRFVFAAAFMASFLLWTIPIRSKYVALIEMFKSIMTHQGLHGQGKEGFVDVHNYLNNWKDIVVGHGVFTTVVVGALIFSLIGLVSKKNDKAYSFIFAVATGILLHLMVVAKHPGPQYFVPGFGLFGALLVLCYGKLSLNNKLLRQMVGGLVAIVIVADIVGALAYRSKLSEMTQEMVTFNETMHAKYQGYTFVNYYRSSGKEWALYLGDAWAGSPKLSEEMNSLYPNSLFLSRWSFLITNFKGRVLADDLARQSLGVIFQGDGEIDPVDFENSPFKVKLLEKGRYECLYLLTASTEKQSIMYYMAAVHFLQEKDLAKSLACAIQARKFHYFPKSTVDTFIEQLTPYVQH